MRPATAARCSAGPVRVSERASLLVNAVFPVLFGGVIARRPRALALIGRLGWEARGIAAAERVHRRHGPGPIRLLGRRRPIALVLDPSDARRLLEETPDPFSPAAKEKQAALAQFQPHGVLISDRAERPARRWRNEAALRTYDPQTLEVDRFQDVVRQETSALLSEREAAPGRSLGWQDFDPSWWRSVRRLVLGEAARDDQALIKDLYRLRRAANWSRLAPRRHVLTESFTHRVRAYVQLAEPGSLAFQAAEVNAADQVPHWLFAYDAAGVTAMRALALLSVHPQVTAEVRAEIAARPADPFRWDLLRAAVLETVRLWPTTPLILRESVRTTSWGDGSHLPAGSLFALYTPYLHRGSPAGPAGDRFSPDLWSRGATTHAPLYPFSAGPASCPGRDVVLLTVTSWLAAVLDRHRPRLVRPHLRPDEPLPATLNHFGLRFTLP